MGGGSFDKLRTGWWVTSSQQPVTSNQLLMILHTTHRKSINFDIGVGADIIDR